MSITSRLLSHYSTDSVLVACKQLVESAFPECALRNKRRDVFELAERAGIRVETVKTQYFDGRFQSDESGDALVTLTSLSGRVRSRFTLAHEIGHWLLRRAREDSGDPVFRGASYKSASDREEEKLANLLAAELLLPAQAIHQELQYTKISMSCIQSIARRFDVSFKASLWRVAIVVQSTFLYLNVVPHRFKDLSTFAEIDEAVFVSPGTGMCCRREFARFVKKYAFQDIATQKLKMLGVHTDLGRFVAHFEVRSQRRPIPNCDLFASLP